MTRLLSVFIAAAILMCFPAFAGESHKAAAASCGPVLVKIIDSSPTSSDDPASALLRPWYNPGEACFLVSTFEIRGTGTLHPSLVLKKVLTGVSESSPTYLLDPVSVDSCSWEKRNISVAIPCEEPGLFKVLMKYKRASDGMIWKSVTKFRVWEPLAE